MEFTFGIITGAAQNNRETLSGREVTDRINLIILSIEAEKMPKYEIIIVGGPDHYMGRRNVTHINFNEEEKPNWITKKKNTVTARAKYDRIVYMHDYMALEPGWYKGMLKYGDDWDICMNRVENIHGGRWIDWITWGDPELRKYGNSNEHQIGTALIPYDYITKFMYVSGAYWIAKKEFMRKYPLAERLVWGQGEDIEWSNRWTQDSTIKYRMNEYSTCKCIKEGKKYSAKFLLKEDAEEAFGTRDILAMQNFYGNTDHVDPWLTDRFTYENFRNKR